MFNVYIQIMSFLYSCARPFLFLKHAENAHDLTLKALKKANNLGCLKYFTQNPVSDPIEIMGLKLPNRVGLAAGLDKNGDYISELGQLGFGFLEIGTVTPKPQPGNKKPRMFRLPECNAIINRMGFNNHGTENLVANVKQSTYGGILGINIGKNASTPVESAVDDYLMALETVYPYSDYVTVNISSPNTKNLRDLQNQNHLTQLLEQLKQKQTVLAQEHGKYTPIVLKIAPDLVEDEIKTIAGLLKEYEFDGVIATNTTIDKSTVEGQKNASEQGGLSGPPVHQKSLYVIEQLRKQLGLNFPIIGVGGIESGKEAVEKIRAGANAIQLYTGLIYKGPALINECAATIAFNCKHKGLHHRNRQKS